MVTISASDIIEELLDPLMFSDLAESSPTVSFERLGPTELLLDFGVPDRVFGTARERGMSGS